MKYFKGDIVEIITAQYKSWNDIPQHERGYFENCNEPAPIIGQRFEVKVIGETKTYERMEKIKVYKLTMYSQTTIHTSQDDILETIREETEDFGTKSIKIEVCEMTQEQVDELPEFDGY